MVNKYENGKIYKIHPICNHDESDIYIGSTSENYLSVRFSRHKSAYKYKKIATSSFKLFDKYGIENCVITLLEPVNCRSKEELLARERFYIQSMKCVNKSIPLRKNNEYTKANKEKIKQWKKEYYELNKDKIKESYRYDKIKEQYSKPFMCECGSECWEGNKSRHFKTKKHQDFINRSK
jgi:ribosome-interacting GTPase 1